MVRNFAVRFGMTTHRSAWPTQDRASDLRASEVVLHHRWAVYAKLVMKNIYTDSPSKFAGEEARPKLNRASASLVLRAPATGKASQAVCKGREN